MLDTISAKLTKCQLFFEAVAKVDVKHAYGASAAFNGLFYINLESGECEFISFFPNEDIYKEKLFYSACCHENKVFFAPQCANYIHVFHLDTNSFSQIEIEQETGRKYFKHIKFCETFVYNNNVIMIGASYPAVLQIDPFNETINYFPIKIEEDFIFRRGLLRNNKYYIASTLSNLFIEINMDTMSICKHYIPNNRCGSWNLCCDTESIWFTKRHEEDCFVKWNPVTNQFVEMDECAKRFLTIQKGVYLYSYYSNGYIYSIPETNNKFIRINVDTLVIEESPFCTPLDNEKVGFFLKDGDKIFLSRLPIDESYFSQENSFFFLLDINTHELTPYKFRFMRGIDKYLQQLSNIIFAKNAYKFGEGNRFDIKKMICTLQYFDKQEDIEHIGNTVGQNIWMSLKKS